jgi:hypothetical protein
MVFFMAMEHQQLVRLLKVVLELFLLEQQVLLLHGLLLEPMEKF